MSRALALGLLLITSFISASVSAAADNEFVNCNYDDEGGGFWTVQNILECQRVSDILIFVAYFSIPIELLYFVSYSNVPFKWVFLQFIAFIVLCGLTHLLNAWTYYGPHSFQLMLSLTVAKFLTALVSCATAITLLTLFPMLLKMKVRELFLIQNVMELDQEVGMMKKKKIASMHVRMLTREIRKSLDKHNILYTTLVELSKTLGLYNCAVWMPNEKRTEMNLTHELRASSGSHQFSIPMNDPDLLDIKATKGVKILRSDSALGAVSSGGSNVESGPVAAIRMPMLRVSNFKGGTPEFVDTCYAILVLVLPNGGSWFDEAMEIVEVVADQVAVALSHAAVLEESQLMREQLSEQNRALQQAKMNATMASQARNSFQKVMSHGMRRPMHSIIGLLSLVQDDSMSFEQKIVVDTLMKASNVLSTLINDAMEISVKDTGRFPIEMRPFRLQSMIKEASCLAKCLCVHKGFGFEIDVQSSLPDLVIGDERRAFQLILHMFGYMLDLYDGRGTIVFRVFLESGGSGGGGEGQNDRMLGMWKANAPDEHASVKFEIEIREESSSMSDGPMSAAQRRVAAPEIKEALRFSMCKKLVQMMQGNIWVSPNAFGRVRSMNLVLRFQTRLSSIGRATLTSSEQLNTAQFNGLKIVLADDDSVNRTVTKKLLEKLGCDVTAVASGFECLSTLSSENSVRVVILDLQMPEMDGFEVATRLRKFRSRNWPLIIALTASAEDHVWERCLQVGMNGVMRKPVLLRAMSDELRRVLQVAG